MKRTTILDVTISVLVLVLAAFTLGPAVARLQRGPEDARCQSNMKRWAQAMSLYLQDNHWSYPTNRAGYFSGQLGGIASDVALTPDDAVNADGSPRRFKYGINWVEALYPYIWRMAGETGQDWKSFRKCPNASSTKWPLNDLGANASMTYTFNYNLVEQPDGVIRDPSKLMMLREVDRLLNSVLRPINDSLFGPERSPYDPFLDTKDEGITAMGNPTTNPMQHTAGSYIVFVDGHVSYFTTDFFPDQANISASKCWDSATRCWYNYVFANPANDRERILNKSIAITPY